MCFRLFAFCLDRDRTIKASVILLIIEALERLAHYSINANLMLFLTDEPYSWTYFDAMQVGNHASLVLIGNGLLLFALAHSLSFSCSLARALILSLSSLSVIFVPTFMLLYEVIV